MLDITKAKSRLGWKPRLDAKKCAILTSDWYKRYMKEDVYTICIDEIEQFVKDYGEDKVTYIFDNDRCGTKIYYDYLIENEYKSKTNEVVEKIVNLTDTYDLYKQDSELWSDADNNTI